MFSYNRSAASLLQVPGQIARIVMGSMIVSAATFAHAAGYTFTRIADSAASYTSFLSAPAVNDNGLVVFHASLTGGGEGIFVGSGGPPTTLADSAGNFANFGTPMLNNTGTAAFVANDPNNRRAHSGRHRGHPDRHGSDRNRANHARPGAVRIRRQPLRGGRDGHAAPHVPRAACCSAETCANDV